MDQVLQSYIIEHFSDLNKEIISPPWPVRSALPQVALDTGIRLFVCVQSVIKESVSRIPRHTHIAHGQSFIVQSTRTCGLEHYTTPYSSHRCSYNTLSLSGT